ncbi:MAG: hypothetical protein O7E54_10345 [Planctomycetota bacterium]|jgi:hypothetical protein|nr:hypothetical protein [Planctomycetota bacterium]
MSREEEIRRRMEEASRRAEEQADETLKEEFEALVAATELDLEALKPKITDQESYDLLIREVQKSTANNESLAQFRQRLKGLGEGVLAVAAEAKVLLRA